MNAIVQYVRDARQELYKVSWPTKQETVNATVMVIAVSVAIAVFLGALDYVFNKGLEYLLINF